MLSTNVISGTRRRPPSLLEELEFYSYYLNAADTFPGGEPSQFMRELASDMNIPEPVPLIEEKYEGPQLYDVERQEPATRFRAPKKLRQTRITQYLPMIVSSAGAALFFSRPDETPSEVLSITMGPSKPAVKFRIPQKRRFISARYPYRKYHNSKKSYYNDILLF